jgi:hypothetical protein
MIAERETTYEEFLARKQVTAPVVGFQVDPDALSPHLFPFQRDCVVWALRRGRAALWQDCGLGKTLQFLTWAEQVVSHSIGPKPVLILAPLGVTHQIVREGEKFGIPVTVCRSGEDVRPGINVTNYQRLHLFNAGDFSGLVLDESSCLKGDGPLRKGVTEFAESIPYRLACTATPAPNDTEELLNHAEFLGIMRGTEILALYFTQDGNNTHKWRLKGHAKRAFWQWLATWAVALRKPSDLGYPDDGFLLPPLNLHQHTVEVALPQDALFQAEAKGIQEQRAVRRQTLQARVDRCRSLVGEPSEKWLIWCDLNDEQDALEEAFGGLCVSVRGTTPDDRKIECEQRWREGDVPVLISKPVLFGHGMNWQHCARMAFVGLGNSYEQYYQAIRRCWRFGQARPVECHVITSEADGPVIRNIERKEREAAEMMQELVREMRGGLGTESAAAREDMVYAEDETSGQGWRLLLGDCVKRLSDVEAESAGLSVFSPPFPSMYAYTNSPHDMGNCADFEEMIEQFAFLVPELLRVTQPGRTCAIHLTQALAFLGKDGHVGMKDFRGRVIGAMEAGGWHYYGEVTIDKDPQLKAIRTKDRGLLFKTLASDSSHMRMALADYLLQFRKPGENRQPIRAGISSKYGNPDGWITQDEWIRWARPVWYAADFAPDGDGIAETDVLNVAVAREAEDERHLCPLQLGVIERALKLWSNPGDLILSPFAGIGSEGVMALRLRRRFCGVELKSSYWATAARNLRQAENATKQGSLLALTEE